MEQLGKRALQTTETTKQKKKKVNGVVEKGKTVEEVKHTVS